MLKILVILSLSQVILASPMKNQPAKVTYAKQGDTPWTVLIQIKDTRCTGSLIKDKFIITAAHCFDAQDDDENDLRLDQDVKIFIGELDLTKDPDCDDDDDNDSSELCVSEPVAEIPPKRHVIHELYSSGGTKNYAYDIAIIELKRPPRKSEIIKNIELAEEEKCEGTLESNKMITSGFGEISHKDYTNVKKITDVDIISSDECKEKKNNRFDSTKHFCARSPTSKITTCKGDSGGPLSQKIDNTDYLFGIVSFGASECGNIQTPTAFVKVACFIDWIEENTAISKKTNKKTKITTPKTTTTEASKTGGESNEDSDEFFG